MERDEEANSIFRNGTLPLKHDEIFGNIKRIVESLLRKEHSQGMEAYFWGIGKVKAGTVFTKGKNEEREELKSKKIRKNSVTHINITLNIHIISRG